MPDFTRIINLAYERILGRPADPGGLSNYNDLMNGGLTEASMRESLLRSAEYAETHPDRGLASARISSKRKKTTRRGKKKGR